ncbi:MAG: CDP-alcohol phosphatidyltransferase family protein [Candidatus Babeliaceae bacterium]|nr:CDP-alcohol phosphatidyltransferase family protein [Candidatus Babeliaceae bacterium]
MNISGIFTLIRLIFSPVLLAPLIALQAPVYITFFLYIFLAATDFLDGYYARKYHQVSELGAFLDQFADKMFLFSVMFATLYTHQLPLSVALLLAFRELAVMGLREYGMKKNISLPVIFSAKLKTVFQMILFAGIVIQPAGSIVRYTTYFLFLVTIALSYYSAYFYLKKFGHIRASL